MSAADSVPVFVIPLALLKMRISDPQPGILTITSGGTYDLKYFCLRGSFHCSEAEVSEEIQKKVL
jgi:hypothetical protein